MAYEHLAEGQWGPVAVGAGVRNGSGYAQSVRCRMAFLEKNGHVHAWAKFRAPNGQMLMVHASTDIAEMERHVTDELKRRLAFEAERKHGQGTAAAGGWFKRRMRKLKKRIKHFTKKSAVFKVLKTIHNTVEKALDNPLVQAALASNPYGAAFLAGRKATKMAIHAIRGGMKSKGKLGQLLQMAKHGNLKAKNILRFVKRQVVLNPKMFKRKMADVQKFQSMFSQAKSSGDEMAELEAFVHGCTSAAAGTYEIAGDYEIMGAGDPLTDQEIDLVEHFATSGSFEGARWLAGRLSLHSMNAHADELSTRQALTTGRDAQAARFAFAAHH